MWCCDDKGQTRTGEVNVGIKSLRGQGGRHHQTPQKSLFGLGGRYSDQVSIQLLPSNKSQKHHDPVWSCTVCAVMRANAVDLRRNSWSEARETRYAASTAAHLMTERHGPSASLHPCRSNRASNPTFYAVSVRKCSRGFSGR
jgi:hypothetical protein